MTESEHRRLSPLIKMLIEVGPLVVFFFANSRFGIFVATGVFMVAAPISVAVSYAFERRLPTMPLVTAIFVLVFGGLTIWLQDETFIKLKPTIVNSLFAVILLGGLLAGRSLLKPIFDSAFKLDDAGWRKLTFRWMLYFVALAILNEFVWRRFSTDTWVSFKTFGIMPLTLLFSLAQLPLLQRHQLPEDEPATDAASR